VNAVLVGYGLFVSVAQVHAEPDPAPAAQPKWSSGDKWTYLMKSEPAKTESTWSRRVISATASGGYDVETKSGDHLVFDADTNFLDSRGAEFTWRRFSFPLTVGKHWTHERKIENKSELLTGNETSTWDVKAYERITVPAGSYDCYRVIGTAFRSLRSERSLGFSRYTTKIVTTYWYCPDVKWVAKWRVETDSAGIFSNVETSELTAFEQN
jgi:hypothetical protein